MVCLRHPFLFFLFTRIITSYNDEKRQTDKRNTLEDPININTKSFLDNDLGILLEPTFIKNIFKICIFLVLEILLEMLLEHKVFLFAF